MSTYTDLHNRIKENLTILRKPGSKDDGMSPQKVILVNPENQFYGTFNGSMNITGGVLSNLSIVGGEIKGTTIKDAQFLDGDTLIPIGQLANTVSNHETRVTKLEEDAEDISAAHDKLSSELSDAIDTLCSDINTKLDDAVENVKKSISGVVGDVATLSGGLEELSGKVENLSSGMLNGVVYKGQLDLHRDSYTRPKQLFNDDPACCLLDGLQKPLRNGWMWRIHLDHPNVSGDYVVVDDPNTGNSLRLGEGDYVIIRNHLPEVYEVVPDDTMGLNDFDVINAQDEDDTKLEVFKKISAYLDEKADVISSSLCAEIEVDRQSIENLCSYVEGFVDGKIEDLSNTVDGRLEALSGDLSFYSEKLCSELCAEIDSSYVHKTGDLAQNLSVGENFNVAGKTSLNGPVTLDDDFRDSSGTKLEISQDKIQIETFAPIVVSSAANASLVAHNLSIDLEDGLNDLFINGESVQEKLDEKLDASLARELSSKLALSSDISWELSDYNNSPNFLVSSDISCGYIKQENKLRLLVQDQKIDIDVAEMFAGKIIRRAGVETDDTGTYIVIVFDVDGDPDTEDDAQTIRIRINDFFRVYEAGYGISIDNKLCIRISEEFVSQVQAIQSYVDELSGPQGPNIGIIQTLSNEISSLRQDEKFEIQVKNLPINNQAFSRIYDSIGAFLCAQLQPYDYNWVRNNTEYLVQFLSGDDGVPLSSRIVINDNLETSLGNGDIILVHAVDDTLAGPARVDFQDLVPYDRSTVLGNTFIIKAGVSRYEFEAEAKKRKDDDDYISAWIKQNFVNTGEENDSLTTVVRQELSANHDLSVASNAYVLSDLSVAGSLFVNGAQLEITVEPSEDPEEDPTTIAKTVADEITLSSTSSDTQITITNNYIAFSKAIVNVDATSSFTVSADEVKVIDATSSQVQILSVLSVETGQAIATKLSSDCLSARILSVDEAFINSLAVSVETALSIQVPFDKLVDPGTGNSAKDEHDQLQAEVDEISTYYLDRRTGGKVSGDIEIISSLAVRQNILQGNSLTSGTGISGTLDQTRIDNVQMSGNCCVALNNSSSFGTQSFAANQGKAYSKNSTAFGNSTAYGSYSLAQGAASNAYGYASHVEGRETQTGLPDYIGCSSNLTAYGCDAHAEGDHTKAIGNFSHAEGSFTEAHDLYSHAEGNYTKVLFGNSGHAEGQQTEVSANYAHAEGTYSKAYGEGSHAEGDYTYAEGLKSHAEGSRTSAIGQCAHAEGLSTIAYGVNSHSEGDQTYAKGQKSHTEGGETSAYGFASHTEGRSTIARARYSHAEGATAEIQEDDEYSFAWSGKFNKNNYYKSHGPGTFSINPQDGTKGFWIGDQPFEYYLSTLEDKMISNDSVLSTAIDRKIFIDGLSVESLCAIHISQDDFYQKVALSLDTIKDNELYIVSENYINAYGQQMKNLSAPTDLSDATTKEYVDQISSTLSNQIQNLSTDLSTEISALTQNLYDQLQHIAEDEIISSLNQKSCISNVICAVVGIKDTLISLRQTLSGMLGL